MIKQQDHEMRWAHNTCTHARTQRTRCSQTILTENCQGKKPLQILWHIQNNLKTNPTQTGFRLWTEFIWQRTETSGTRNLQVPYQALYFLTTWMTVSLIGRTLASWWSFKVISEIWVHTTTTTYPPFLALCADCMFH